MTTSGSVLATKIAYQQRLQKALKFKLFYKLLLLSLQRHLQSPPHCWLQLPLENTLA